MTNVHLADLLERLVVAGVAITTRALSEAAPGVDLTFPQWRVVLILGESPDGATVSQVAARVGVTLPATSRQLRRLASRGLLEIARDEQDHRAARARLTAQGAAVRDAILRYRRQCIDEVAERLSIADRTVLELDRITAAFDVYR